LTKRIYNDSKCLDNKELLLGLEAALRFQDCGSDIYSPQFLPGLLLRFQAFLSSNVLHNVFKLGLALLLNHLQGPL